jgi:hypothetical protein
MDKLNDIKNKYAGKMSYRSAVTDFEGDLSSKRTTVRKKLSPYKPKFDLIDIK